MDMPVKASSRRARFFAKRGGRSFKPKFPKLQTIPGLAWRRDRDGTWTLCAGRRRFGRVVPDGKHAGMWCSIRTDGRYSDMANLSHAKNAVLVVAERELAFEDRRRRATDPSNCPEKRGVFSGTASPMRQNEQGDL
jgi:hypothetical protein